jgi:hypothetical protein
VNDGDLVAIPREHGDGFHYVLVGPGGAFCTCPGFERWGHCWAATAVWENKGMTQEITVRKQDVVQYTQNDLKTLTALSSQLIADGSVAVPENLKNEGEVLAVMLAGLESGVQPMTALRHIAVVNGKTEADAQLMVAICMTKEDDIRFEIMREDAASTTVRLTRPSKGFVKEFTYTDQMAKDANLFNKGAWVTHRPVMRQWAAFKRLARAYCNDLINSVMKPVQIQAPDQDDPDALPRPKGVQAPPHDPEQGDVDAIDADYIDRGPVLENLDPPPEPGEPQGSPPSAPDAGSAPVTSPASPPAPPDLAEPVIDVATCNDDQAATITDYYDAMRDVHGQEALTRFQDAAAQRWAYAAQDGTFRASRLTVADADALIQLLKAALDSRDGIPPDTAGLL